MSASILATGLRDAAKFFEALPDIATQAAVYAVNDVATGTGLNLVKREMTKEVNFPTGYLDSRLTVVRKATPGQIEAVIRGRDRATSLARFAPGQTPENTRKRGKFTPGVRVTVAPGKTKLLKQSFIVRLRNGNLGLAVRVKAGESLQHSTGAVRLANNLYLLYGPSVDQVFSGVADKQLPVLSDMLDRRFIQQFTRLVARG